MNELNITDVLISDKFWLPRLSTNAKVAIIHEWQQLETSGCINNFRLAAGKKDGFREGWFFSDSDAYKWLDAAACVYAGWPSDKLKRHMDGFIALVARAQEEDGYIFTYNQIHFPQERWGNLMIEHELYCHGHLIEAGVSHFTSTGEETALKIAIKAANLLVENFLNSTPENTPGHEEIEIALLRLYQLTKQEIYLELARQFIERRGRIRSFSLLLLRQNARVMRRRRFVNEQRKKYLENHPGYNAFQLPKDNEANTPRWMRWRWLFSTLSGKYFQQHVPIRAQKVPVGHAVRYVYLQTAISKLFRNNNDSTLLPSLTFSWDHLTSRRMYVTGGIGSLPVMEGFGRDYELDPEIAYSETCASLGNLFWNWEMALITKEACYSDLFEWQLYNSVSVGMGLGGKTFLYNNPLLSKGSINRQPWFLVPCCPSNLSRTWASMGKYIYSFDEQNLWVHQFIANHAVIKGLGLKVEVASGIPWNGNVKMKLNPGTKTYLAIHFRIPSWTDAVTIQINGEPFNGSISNPHIISSASDSIPASGYDPHQAYFLTLKRIWAPGDEVELCFTMPVTLRQASPKVRGHSGKVALTRGPLVYCLESVDNQDIDIFNVRLDPSTVYPKFAPALLGGINILHGKSSDSNDLVAIPYHLWANRGESKMTVWIRSM